MCFFVKAQNNNVAAIKSYYNSLNKNKLIDEMVTKNNLTYKEAHKLSGNPGDSIKKADLINILDNSSLVMIELRLKNAKDYSFDKDIYDFLEIYEDKTKITHLDKNNGEMTILGFDGGLKNIKYDEQESSSLLTAWEIIRTETPEVLIGNCWVFKDKSEDNHNFIMINGDKIRVYRSKYKDMYELNEFVRKFFNESEFKQRALLYEEGVILFSSL